MSISQDKKAIVENGLLYCCYSKPQKDYLKANGIGYKIIGKSISTDNTFWVYIRSKKLNKLLNDWSLKNN